MDSSVACSVEQRKVTSDPFKKILFANWKYDNGSKVMYNVLSPAYVVHTLLVTNENQIFIVTSGLHVFHASFSIKS